MHEFSSIIHSAVEFDTHPFVRKILFHALIFLNSKKKHDSRPDPKTQAQTICIWKVQRTGLIRKVLFIKRNAFIFFITLVAHLHPLMKSNISSLHFRIKQLESPHILHSPCRYEKYLVFIVELI